MNKPQTMIKAKCLIYEREVCYPLPIFASTHSTQNKIPHSSLNLWKLNCYLLKSVYKTPWAKFLCVLISFDPYHKKAIGAALWPWKSFPNVPWAELWVLHPWLWLQTQTRQIYSYTMTVDCVKTLKNNQRRQGETEIIQQERAGEVRFHTDPSFYLDGIF